MHAGNVQFKIDIMNILTVTCSVLKCLNTGMQ